MSPLRIGDVTFPHKMFCATGARGFFGEGYWYHRYAKHFGLTWKNTNFSAKTTTLHPRQGNMPLAKDGISPAQLFPRCIIVHWKSGHVLNSVGLSGPGFEDLLNRGIWQEMTEPLSLSVMAVGKTPRERESEYIGLAEMLDEYLEGFLAKIILQINFGCPNAGLHLEELFDEARGAYDIFSDLNVALTANFNALVPVSLLKELQKQGWAGFFLGNTLPYDHDNLGREIFGCDQSPLLTRGFPSAGGLSGPRCRIYTLRKLREARLGGIYLPTVAGNGLRTTADVYDLRNAGADGVFGGSIAMVPQAMSQMHSVIATANEIL